MILSIIILIISLIVLVKASEILIDSSVGISKFFGVSNLFMGMTLIAIGTSLPELASGIIAAFSNHTGIVVGNIIGSNITNITLILGISSIMITTSIKKDFFTEDIKILIGICFLFLILSLDKQISWVDGVLLLTIFLVYIIYQFKKTVNKRPEKITKLITELYGNEKSLKDLTQEEKEILKNIDYITYKKLMKKGIDIKQILKSNKFSKISNLFGIAIISIIGIIISAKYLVASAVDLAQFMNISEELIGMSVIAFGTSIPELAITITSARKHLPNILIGNLIGSNISNILVVGGISSLITPLMISNLDLIFTIPFMILLTLMFKKYINTKWLTRILNGLTLLFFYLLFLFVLALISGVIRL
jgi:cation:H+ antiporter